MFKPPFTVIIIKKTYEPRTVKVTYRLILSAFVVFSLLCILSGVLISIALSRFNMPVLKNISNVNEQHMSISTNANKGKISPEIKNLSIKNKRKNNSEIIFSLSNVSSYKIVYVWVIVNPNAKTAGETIIYPRNPVFSGFPVDYRNGIEFFPSVESKIKIELSGLTPGIDYHAIKILVYTPDGKLIANRFFNIKGKKETDAV